MHCDDPFQVFSGLSNASLETFVVDIEGYVELEKRKSGRFKIFWESLLEVVKGDMARRRTPQTSVCSLHKAVDNDIKGILEGKSLNELQNLVDDVQKTIRDGRSYDTEYWEVMIKEIRYEMARRAFEEAFREVSMKQKVILSQLQQDRKSSSSLEEIGTSSSKVERTVDEVQVMGADLEESEEKMEFTDEISLPNRKYTWQDKYRPRKPRYFNRIKTGYDWNKYNSTHYDHDNPPPKTVHGYKFNVFFPDLIDASTTPQYFLEPADEKEFAILRFHAGPPYEDVAFKIINREWDSGKRSGFKCVFERGVLQLHFNFKRAWYRR